MEIGKRLCTLAVTVLLLSLLTVRAASAQGGRARGDAGEDAAPEQSEIACR